jgi:CheY-like chemotaxis protein
MRDVDVLLVDDNDAVRALLTIILSSTEGIGQVREASDGRDALVVCRDFTPDLVVLDYWMPFLDGAQAAKLIRQMHPRTRIVAYSAALEGKPDWADAYLTKGAVPEPEYLIDIARSAPGSVL